VLPDPGADTTASPPKEVSAVDDLASPQAAGAAVTAATTQLSKDLADPKATPAAFTADLQHVDAALKQAGITTPPLATIVNDLVDPKGQKTQAPAALAQAAQAQGIDLATDNTNATTAENAVRAALAQQPVVPAAVDLATAHLARATALGGGDLVTTLAQVAADLPASNTDGLSALYAAAAKNGVDLSGKDADAITQAKNRNAQLQQKRASSANAAARADRAANPQNYSDPNYSGGGSAGGSDAKGPINYSGGAPANTQQYASIPKSGPGTSNGGWDTTGNVPIAPNPDNPVDFQKDYGISGGFSSESLDDLLAKVPQLTSQYPNIKDILTTAANSVNPPIPPQLLLSTLGVETSYATNNNNGQDGPFQFIASTFAAYGSGDRTNMQDAANACANYYRTLLNDNGGDLYAAMRDYNGDINQGASNSYQADQQSIFNGNVNLE
jgi:hypothetical protein